MRRSLTLLSAAGAVLALAAQLSAGGFWLMLGNPDASPEARSMHAVLTVMSTGCVPPAQAKFVGTAVGVVNGKRQSIPLKLARLSTPGMFALTRQWPAEGKWVIQLVGTNQNMVANVLVAAGPDGVDRAGAKYSGGQPNTDELEAMLRAGPAPAALARK